MKMLLLLASLALFAFIAFICLNAAQHVPVLPASHPLHDWYQMNFWQYSGMGIITALGALVSGWGLVEELRTA
ncbi:MAG: hypothetical protein KGI70_02265 [Patescibacteria group bacterium]|nr:hypothetical protein [Patescibacteria group bacterium]